MSFDSTWLKVVLPGQRLRSSADSLLEVEAECEPIQAQFTTCCAAFLTPAPAARHSSRTIAEVLSSKLQTFSDPQQSRPNFISRVCPSFDPSGSRISIQTRRRRSHRP